MVPRAGGTPRASETPLARLGSVEVSRYETATGPRLHLRRAVPPSMETYLDPLELEGLTRVRFKPIALIPGGVPNGPEESARPIPSGQTERLQNEFALVNVGVASAKGGQGLLIRDMNAGQAVVLSPDELEALLAARHRDFAPLIDTSDLVSIPEPDIDEA
jgi:hypothetical protein